jgi:PAS domain S-box-containing protein
MARYETKDAAGCPESPALGQPPDVETIAGEVADLRRRLEEAEATIRAIQADEVDAFVVSHGKSDRIVTLQSADRPYRRFVEAMGQAAVTLSHQGTILYANRAFAQLVARPLASIIGTAIDEFLAASSRWIRNKVIGHGLVGHGEASFVRGGGALVPVHVTASRFSDNPEMLCLVITDLTDQHRLAEVTAAERRKDEFLAVLAHELRNPLAAIDNAAKVAHQSSADREAQEWAFAVIERQVQQLTRLVDDLLDISRISRGKIQLRKELIDARVIVERAAQVVQPLMTDKGRVLDVAMADQPLPVEADPARLEQILVNLLGNAAKFTDRDGRIMISAQAEGGEVVLRVVDNGIGISAEKLPLVFRMFEQVEESIERSSGGLGIGLTLVKSLAELQGGTVAAESAGLGRGSTFTVRLPRAAAAGTLDVTTTTASPSAPQRKDARILIVDDNVDSVEGLARLLRRQGFEVETAHDGPSALEAAALRPPAFVFLDIGLPGLDGYQVAERLRGLLEGAVTICAVSGYGRDEDRKRAQAAGFDHFLIKPIDFNEMMALLAQAGRGA